MASASALAGAFTTLGVSANRAAAKKTNVVAKKVRVEMPSVPNKSTRSSTSSFPRVARARRWLVRPAISTARAFAAGAIDGDRCRTRDRAIARRARLGRERPRSVLVARLFSSPTGQFLTRGLPTRDASNARSPRLFSALDPQAFSARSAVRSVKRDLTVRLRAAPRGSEPRLYRYVFATWCPVSLREGWNGEASEAFEPPRRATRAPRRSRAAPLGEGNRASPRPRRSGRRADHAGAPSPRSPACSSWRDGGGRAEYPDWIPCRSGARTPRSFRFRDVAGKNAAAFFFERARKKGAATAPFVSARAFC